MWRFEIIVLKPNHLIKNNLFDFKWYLTCKPIVVVLSGDHIGSVWCNIISRKPTVKNRLEIASDLSSSYSRIWGWRICCQLHVGNWNIATRRSTNSNWWPLVPLSERFSFLFHNDVDGLILCSRVTPYGDIDLGQHWFKLWRHQAITRANVDLLLAVSWVHELGKMSTAIVQAINL